MNFEEAQRVATKKRTSKKQQETLANEQVRKELLDCQKFIEDRKMFLELVDGKEELFKKCIDYIFLTQLVPAINRNTLMNADYCSGFRDGLEAFTSTAKVVKAKEEHIEKLRGELK